MIPKIENAYENIKNACETRLKELYPLGVPKLIKERYELELSFLKHSNYLDDFEIMRILFTEAEKSSYPMDTRTSNDSYIQYLLTKSDLNPLPAHYYCERCGHFEAVSTRLFGIDLPADSCPNCGSPLSADGFNLSFEWTWGIDGTKRLGFEYDITKEFLPFAKRALQKCFPSQDIVPYGVFYREDKNDKKTHVLHGGFFILPFGQTIEDYPDMIAYLENGEKCLTKTFYDIRSIGLHDVLMTPNDTLEKTLILQRKTGFYSKDITLNHLHELSWNEIINTNCLSNAGTFLFQTFRPKSFYDMVSLFSVSHSTFVDTKYAPIEDKYFSLSELLQNSEFTKYPCYTKDDFYDTLIELGYEKSQAFQIATAIQKGQANSTKQPHVDYFKALELPNDFLKVAKTYLHLWGRSACVNFILRYAKMAYYSKIDSRIFGQSVHK